jgi:hypothetical protein
MPRWRIVFHSFCARLVIVAAVLGLIIGFPVLPLVSASPGSAIAPDDEAALVTHLQILAVEYNTHSSNICTNILSKPIYASQDWVDFFTHYFDQYPFTTKLYEYLTWPAFWATANDTQVKLQSAVGTVLLAKIAAITAAHPQDLSAALGQDPYLRETISNAHRWQINIAINGKLTNAQKQKIFDFYIQYVNDYPHYWRKTSTIDTVNQPFIAALAAQNHAVLRELVTNQTGNRPRFVEALNLQGRYLELWNHFSLLLYDNNGFDKAQQDFIYNYYNALPRQLRMTRAISQMEFIGNTFPNHLPLWLPGVNVFNTRIGAFRENPFPEDFLLHECDGFVEVVAHEVNHPIFADYVEKDPELNAEFKRLIDQAGHNHNHYLRSMFPDGFFVENPQELFASVANQYFCSSEETFRLGLERFSQGNPHPLDQALFFADIYSLGENETIIYTIDLQAKIWKRSIPIERDGNGRIASIHLPSESIYLLRDAEGTITEVGNSPPRLNAPAELNFTVQAGSVASRKVTLHNDGSMGMHVTIETQGAQRGGVLDLPGGAGVRVPNAASLNPSDQITIAAWVFPRTWEDGWLNNGRILQKGYSDQQYRLAVEDGRLMFDLYQVGSLSIPNWKPPLYTWTHVAAVYDGEHMQIYINGEKKAESSTTGKIQSGIDPLYIGNKDNRLVDSFIGQMDEVAVWSTARTETQIRQDMQAPLDCSAPGIAACWIFETTGESVWDSSPNANHGAIEGQGSQIEGIVPVRWLSITPHYLEMGAGGAAQFTITVSAQNLSSGYYSANLNLSSNDPNRPNLRVPVHVLVYAPLIQQYQFYLPILGH